MTGRPLEVLYEDDAGRWHLTAASEGLARRDLDAVTVEIQYARSFHVGGSLEARTGHDPHAPNRGGEPLNAP